MELRRVYHPESNEPFDLPVGKANELVLNKGWLQQPFDTSVIAEVAAVVQEDGRGSRSRRKAEEPEPVQEAGRWPDEPETPEAEDDDAGD